MMKMKYLIEKKENEVKFKEITLNVEEYGDTLVELSNEELDQQLKEYSKQGLYVSVYYQVKTMRHGIEFWRKRFLAEQWANPDYNLKPIDMPDDEPHSEERTYSIRPTLIDVEINDSELYSSPYTTNLYQPLTQKELADIIREYLKKGMQVYFGHYKYKRKKWKFIPHSRVKEVTDDGQILYY